MGREGQLFNIIKKYDSDNKGALTDDEVVNMLRGYNIIKHIDDIHKAKDEIGIERGSNNTSSDLGKIINSREIEKLMNRDMMRIFAKMDYDNDNIVSKEDFSRMTSKYFINFDMKCILNNYFSKSDVLTLTTFVDLMNDA